MKLKPQTSKGTYMRSITISTTHGPGIKIDTAQFTAAPKAKVAFSHQKPKTSRRP